MSSQTPKSAESTIQEARQHYAEKRFKSALEQFTRAMKLCPCARGLRRERCTCKNFEKVALEGGSIFNEAMYTCKCSVGKTFNKCDNALHIQALDYRAATFEALQELNRAQRDAEWILELAPRVLEGYLRLGKIARLQKKYEFAWKVYNTGIEVGKIHGLGANPKMQTLYTLRQPLQRRFSRRDPLKNPQEIVQRIFHFIDFATLVRCLRVSKSWRGYVSSRGNERLWRAFIFQKEFPLRFAPSTAAVKALLSYSGNDVREVIISNAQRFRLTQKKFNAILQASKNLERLSMREAINEQLQIPARRPLVFNKLAHVQLENFLKSQPNFLRMLVIHCAETLQSLHLSALPAVGSRTDLELPNLPQLKLLWLEEHDSPYPLRLEIFTFAAKSPRVQHLRLHDVRLGYDELHRDISSTEIDELWKDLKTFTLGVEDITVWDPETAEIVQKLTALRRGTDFQHIDFDFHWKWDEHGPLARGGLRRMFNHQLTPLTVNGVDLYNQYDDLRSMRLTHAVISSTVMERSVAGAVQAGKLHTLDLVFPLERHGSAEGAASTEYLREHEWLRGATSIRNMGVFNFRFRSHPRDDEMPLPAFLASFPNLETLEIRSQHYDITEFYTVLEAILKVTKLRTLYQTAMQGVLLDWLTALTEKAGVELISGTRPREWPRPIED
ncbi:hypothetical protein B0J13DRAFT_621398 [Dactylonectria estremocensis]|uniref:F-box domain-containing protein n=1 Tax=Dactylonectria estremocensis TaxID=1079267 RepID=A0A9P9F1M3_9HYPO|nr:hypothetical protein B0J13DRAFT_621398 [Dactylonectria estremocensis]